MNPKSLTDRLSAHIPAVSDRLGWVRLLVPILLFVTLLAYNAHFMRSLATGFFRADYWRHFSFILLPFFNDEADWTALWQNSHHNVGLHLHQIASIHLFQADLSVDGLFIMALNVAIALIFIALAGHAARGQNQWLGFGLIVIVLLTLLGPRNIVFYSWPLVGLQFYAFAAYAALLASYYKVIDQARLHTGLTVLVVALTLVLLLCHYSFGLLFIVSILGAVVLRGLLSRNYRMLIHGLPALGTLIVYSLFLTQITPSSGDGGPGLWALLSPSGLIDALLAYSGRIVSALVFDPEVMNTIITEHVAARILAVFVLLGLLASALAALRSSRLGFVTGAIILASGLFSLAVLVERTNTADTSAAILLAPRYQAIYRLAAMAILLNLAVQFSGILLRHNGQRLSAIAAIVGIVVLSLASLTGAVKSHMELDRMGRSSIVWGQRQELSLYMTGLPENAFRLPQTVIGGNQDYDDVLAYLIDGQLNVFSTSYNPVGPTLERYKAGRRLVRNSDSRARAVTELHLAGDTSRPWRCETLQASSTPAALSFKAQSERTVGDAIRLMQDGSLHFAALIQPGQQTFYIALPAHTRSRLCIRTNVSIDQPFLHTPNDNALTLQ